MSKYPDDNICPVCKSNWDGGSIVETFIKQREEGVSIWQGMTDLEIEQYVTGSYSPPYRWGRVIGIEIQGKYDGISRYRCPDCNTEWDRFTKEKISK